MTTTSWSKALEHVDKAFRHLWYDRYDQEMEHGDMVQTPIRFVKMLAELTDRERAAFNFTVFPSDSDEMVVVQDIPFVTLCAHHVLPFIGRAHVGYVPDGRIAGLSKLARAVQYCAKGLHVQEHLTTEIANFIDDRLDPAGLAIVIKAEHTCMTIRGVQAVGTLTTTSVMRGVFADHDRLARTEFFQLIKEA